MSTDCRFCGGSGKARRIAIVGEPLPKDQMGAMHRIQGEVRPADHVVCFSDFAQMVSAGANHIHSRERDKTLEEAGDFDEVIDLSPPKDEKKKADDAARVEANKVVATPGSPDQPATTPAPDKPVPPEGMTPGVRDGGPPPKLPPSEPPPATGKKLFK